MESLVIECKLIDVPKAKAEDRTFSKEFAIKLADTIRIDGLLQAIVVRKNPASPGRYIMVAGRHRLYATKNVLKEQMIEARVIDDMDDEEARIASKVENLWRNPLSKAQHALAVKEWHEHWLNRTAGKADAKAEAADQAANSHNEKSDAVTGTSDSEQETTQKADSEAKFDETVATATGQSVGSVRRAKRIGESFTEDQIEVFTQMSVSQTDMLQVAKIKDVGQRGEVVNLIAAGMTVDDAIKEVMKEKAPVRDNSGTKAEREAKKAAAQDKDPELTDDQWFSQNCGEKAAMLKHPEKFKADALLYRAVTDIRHAFRVKAKKAVAATKKTGLYGGFTNLINRFISVSHPKDWLICPECKGAGEGPNLVMGQPAPRCNKCFGGGFLLKTEEYI